MFGNTSCLIKYLSDFDDCDIEKKYLTLVDSVSKIFTLIKPKTTIYHVHTNCVFKLVYQDEGFFNFTKNHNCSIILDKSIPTTVQTTVLPFIAIVKSKWFNQVSEAANMSTFYTCSKFFKFNTFGNNDHKIKCSITILSVNAQYKKQILQTI